MDLVPITFEAGGLDPAYNTTGYRVDVRLSSQVGYPATARFGFHKCGLKDSATLPPLEPTT